MRKSLLAMMTLAWSLSGCAWEPAAAQEHESPHVCHAITDPDSFIKAAASRASAMTIVHAAEFGKAAGYERPLIAAFVLPDDNTLIVVVDGQPKGYAECFTSVHEDGATWAAVQKFFGRGA